jgi:hypothetical protein
VPRQELHDLEVRDRLARRVGVERHARRLAPVAADRRLDPSAARARAAPHERQVLPLDLALTQRRLEPLVCLVRAGHDQQPRRVAVEAVDDARPVRVLPARRLPDEPVDERARASAGAGVHGDAGGLVDDEQVLVLEGDAQRDVLLLERRSLRLGLERELLSPAELVTLRRRSAVEGDPTAFDQALGRRARAHLGQRGEEPVEPEPGRLVRNAKPQGDQSPAAS